MEKAEKEQAPKLWRQLVRTQFGRQRWGIKEPTGEHRGILFACAAFPVQTLREKPLMVLEEELKPVSAEKGV